MPLTRLLAALVAGLAVLGGSVAVPASAAPAQGPAEPATVAVVVPLTVRPEERGIVDATTLELYTSPMGSLTRRLDAIIDSGAAIALDPMLLASIRALGAAAPPSALAWLERLESAPNDVFLLAYGDADLGELARADALDLARPLDLSFALAPEGFPEPPADATPTPAPTVPGIPGTSDLLAWPGALADVAWPREGGLTETTAARLAEAGYARVVVDSRNLSGAPATARAALAGVDGLEAIVADGPASDLFREAVFAIGEAEWEDAQARLSEAVAGLATAAAGRTIVLTLDRRWPVGVFRLAQVVEELDALPSVRVRPLGDVLDGPRGNAQLADPEPDADRASLVDAAVAGARAEMDFSSVLDEPLALTAPRRAELLAALSLAWAGHEDAWRERIQEFAARSRAITTSVQIVEGSNLLVTSGSAVVPITVSNEFELPVTVRVAATPVRPLIRIASPEEVTVEPGSSRTIRLPAEAVTNGSVTVRVVLTSPVTGVQIGSSRALTVELQAQWEAVGMIVGAVLVVVFAAGVVRNIVKRRRETRAASDG